MPADDTYQSSAHHVEHGAAPSEVAEAFKNGPVGALVVASIATALLVIGWLAFYFLLFLPRGPIG